jgi:carbon storage regulator
MLVLTRRVGQALKIGDDVEITVLQISGDQVRLGITAPRQVQVNRKELVEQIAQENVLAAQSAAGVEDLDQVLPQAAPQPEQEKSR